MVGLLLASSVCSVRTPKWLSVVWRSTPLDCTKLFEFPAKKLNSFKVSVKLLHLNCFVVFAAESHASTTLSWHSFPSYMIGLNKRFCRRFCFVGLRCVILTPKDLAHYPIVPHQYVVFASGKPRNLDVQVSWPWPIFIYFLIFFPSPIDQWTTLWEWPCTKMWKRDRGIC